MPAGLTFLWMTVFGNTSIDLIMHHSAEELGHIVQSDVSLALFKFLEYFPFSNILSGISVVMIVIFFVTSSDSSAYGDRSVGIKGWWTYTDLAEGILVLPDRSGGVGINAGGGVEGVTECHYCHRTAFFHYLADLQLGLAESLGH